MKLMKKVPMKLLCVSALAFALVFSTSRSVAVYAASDSAAISVGSATVFTRISGDRSYVSASTTCSNITGTVAVKVWGALRNTINPEETGEVIEMGSEFKDATVPGGISVSIDGNEECPFFCGWSWHTYSLLTGSGFDERSIDIN